MGSGIKMSILLFSFALISAISIEEVPENKNVYVKTAVIIDKKSVEYKLGDLNIIEPLYIILPKNSRESFSGPPENNDGKRKLLENYEHINSRRLLKKANLSKKSPASVVAQSSNTKTSVNPSNNFKIFIACDNEFNLYVNGNKIGSGNTWTKTYEFNTDVKTDDVIAIDGIDKGGVAGFIGFFNGKITKPSEWKCSTQKSDNWNKNEFDDSQWNIATSYGKNNGNNIWMSVGNGPRPNIPDNAEWLWTNNNNNHDRIYCRFFYNEKKNNDEKNDDDEKKKNDEKINELINDMKENHNISSNRIKTLKLNVLKLINDEREKMQTELFDSKKVISLTNDDIEKLKQKYTDNMNVYHELNETITKLEYKIKKHYEQMESDSKYLSVLEKIKPSFLETLKSYSKITIDVKDMIINNIIDGHDKEYMLRVLYEMNEKTSNMTSVLSTEFIKHYEKYKNQFNIDKDEYDKEYKELSVFKEKYDNQRILKDRLFKDYTNALDILNKLQDTYNMDEEDIKSFNELSIFIKNIFDYKKC